MVSTKLYIGNLPDLCRQEELQAKFEKYGNVVEFDIVSNYGFAVSTSTQYLLQSCHCFLNRWWLLPVTTLFIP